jgi:aerobic carbon-monoxide dehydrogenase medium subunit
MRVRPTPGGEREVRGRMKLPAFEYRAPTSLEEAVALMAADGDAKIISGGQSLMPVLAFRLNAPSVLVDLCRLPGLDRIEIGPGGVRLGARVRWCEIERHPGLRAAQPLLVAMIDHVAHTQVRNRGTVGGSLAHADPASEMPGYARLCDAVIEAVGPDGARDIPAAEFFRGPLETALAPAEVLTAVRLPAWSEGRRWAFQEVARRKGDFAMAGVAVFFDAEGDGAMRNLHAGAIGAGSTPLRLSSVEALLEGRRLTPELAEAAGAAAAEEASPMVDDPDEAEYRRALVATLTARTLKQAAGLEVG